MAYTPQTWHDTPATDTPISAARLGVMEAGIAAAATDPELLNTSLYNWKASNTRRLQKSLSNAALDTGLSSHVVLGDSLCTAYTGSVADYTNSWWRILKRTMVASGFADGGTGWVRAPGTASLPTLDPRFSTTGTWSANATWTGNTGGAATYTFTSDVPGTAVDLEYFNNSAAFTLSVDGAAPVSPNRTGASTLATHSITGLANTIHTMVVSTAVNNTYLCAFRVRRAGGVEFHNLGVQFGISATSWYTATGFSDTRTLTTTVLPDPDCVHMVLGINDLATGRTPAQISTDVTSILGLYPNATRILYLPMQPSSGTNADWDAVSAAFYTIADTLDIPLVDLHKRYGTYATWATTNQMVGADNNHPKSSVQQDMAGVAFAGLREVGIRPQQPSAVAKIDFTAVSTPPTPTAGTARMFAGTGQGLDAVGYLNTIGVPVVMGRDVLFIARNTSGSTITKGSAVYISSASASNVFISKAQADSGMTKLPCAGIVVADIANNATGLVMQNGVIGNVNTGGMGDGSPIFVDPTTPGAFTATRPTHPNVAQMIGVVEDANLTTGTLLVCCTQYVQNRDQGVNGTSWAIGDATGTIKSLLMKNAAGTGTMQWTPTANRTLTLPDVTGTLAAKDANGNFSADAFIPDATSTATAAGTTVLTVDSTEIQIFTGTTTQIVTLPTTGIVAGQRYTFTNLSSGAVTVNASGGTTVTSIAATTSVTVQANIATPTTNGHWNYIHGTNGIATLTGTQTLSNKTLTAPVINGAVTGTGVATAATVSTLALRDASGNLTVNNLAPAATSTATAAGTTTLTITSAAVQIFTGTTTQTVKLPTTSVTAGMGYTIVNRSTGAVTVQSSAGNVVAVLPGSASMTSATFIAAVATPTTAANWSTDAALTPGWGPLDCGWIAWNFDPAASYSTSAMVAGYMGLMTVKIPVATTITNLIMCVGTAGVTLTANQCKAALYQNGTLLASTADQATAWTTPGVKTMALTAAQAVEPGYVQVGYWGQGTTMPLFVSGIESTAVTPISNAGNRLRYAYATAGGVTTTAPGTVGAVASLAPTWVAVS